MNDLGDTAMTAELVDAIRLLAAALSRSDSTSESTFVVTVRFTERSAAMRAAPRFATTPASRRRASEA